MMQKPPTKATESAHRELSKTLPFTDTTDLSDVDRGFLGSLEPGVVLLPMGESCGTATATRS